MPTSLQHRAASPLEALRLRPRTGRGRRLRAIAVVPRTSTWNGETWFEYFGTAAARASAKVRGTRADFIRRYDARESLATENGSVRFAVFGQDRQRWPDLQAADVVEILCVEDAWVTATAYSAAGERLVGDRDYVRLDAGCYALRARCVAA